MIKKYNNDVNSLVSTKVFNSILSQCASNLTVSIENKIETRKIDISVANLTFACECK